MGFLTVLQRRSDAWARLCGSEEHPMLRGCVRFYQTACGVLVAAEVQGLPHTENGVFGFHIHGGGECRGTEDDPFAEVGVHYDTADRPHPRHAGDLPPLLAGRGHGFQVFLTDRFTVDEVVGRTVIIHSDRDDFVSQPGGNAGKKIACGEIRRRGECGCSRGNRQTKQSRCHH